MYQPEGNDTVLLDGYIFIIAYKDFMSKLLEVVKDVLAVAVVIMLLVYVFKYHDCINELQMENDILKKYMNYQENQDNSSFYIDYESFII